MPALSPSYMRRQPLLGGIIHGIADNVKAFNSHLADLAHPDPTPTTSPPPVTSALDNGNRHGQGDDDHDDDGGDHDGDEDDHDGDGNHHDGDGKDDGKHGKNGNKNGGGGDNNNGGGDDGNSGGATLSSPPPNEPPQGGSPTPTGPSAPPPDATKGGAATSGTSPSESPPDGTETTSNSNAGHQPGLPVDNSNKKTTSPSSSSTPETSQPSSGGGSSKAEFGSSTETTSSAVITFLPSGPSLGSAGAGTIIMPSASALSASSANTQARTQSHTGAIAGGVIGGLVFLGLLVLGILFFLRRRKNHTAPSAEFLTVYPPETPFARAASFRSGLSEPAPLLTAEKYGNNYPQPMMNYP